MKKTSKKSIVFLEIVVMLFVLSLLYVGVYRKESEPPIKTGEGFGVKAFPAQDVCGENGEKCKLGKG